jgi:predicted branched-subunit amino acid permease
MHWFEMLAMSILVFAGSSQLAALPLIASGAPLLVIFATAFCVNLRFVVFSLHLRQYVMHRQLRDRLLFGYLMADLSYVLLVKRFPHVPTEPDRIAALEAYWLGIGWMGWATWGGTTLVGLVLGNVVPPQWGLAFAGILALVGVAMSLVTSRLRMVSAVVAGGAAIAAFALPLRLNILVAIATAVAICLALDKAKRVHAKATR